MIWWSRLHNIITLKASNLLEAFGMISFMYYEIWHYSVCILHNKKSMNERLMLWYIFLWYILRKLWILSFGNFLLALEYYKEYGFNWLIFLHYRISNKSRRYSFPLFSYFLIYHYQCWTEQSWHCIYVHQVYSKRIRM